MGRVPLDTEAALVAAEEAHRATLVAATGEFLERLRRERRQGMCDYSISAASQRDAAVGDRLTAKKFGVTKGFHADGSPLDCATCLKPGTELAFDEDRKWWSISENKYLSGKVARFRQIDTDNPYAHHDAFEAPDGTIFKVNDLDVGVRATVLQLPAAPKTAEEAKAQERVEQVA